MVLSVILLPSMMVGVVFGPHMSGTACVRPGKPPSSRSPHPQPIAMPAQGVSVMKLPETVAFFE